MNNIFYFMLSLPELVLFQKYSSSSPPPPPLEVECWQLTQLRERMDKNCDKISIKNSLWIFMFYLLQDRYVDTSKPKPRNQQQTRRKFAVQSQKAVSAYL